MGSAVNAPIALNLLPLLNQQFTFQVYRQRVEANEPLPDGCDQRRLPVSPGLDEYQPYAVSFDDRAGFEPFNCEATTSYHLTAAFLLRLLLARSKELLPPTGYIHHPKDFRRRLAYVIATHPEGKETVWLEPYYLKSERVFGFLLDFEFSKAPHATDYRRIQQLSLSLDKRFRSNVNFYQDRHSKIAAFLKSHVERLFPLIGDGASFDVARQLLQLPSSRLAPKSYLFAGERRGVSQFKGVKDFGPLQPVDTVPHIVFVYQETERELSRILYRALRGELFPATFPGLDPLFRVQFDSKNVSGVAVQSFDTAHMRPVFDEIQHRTETRVIAVMIAPWEEDDDEYYRIKYDFLQHKVPVQFVRPKTIRDRESLKWAISNIALQIFAKLGGEPWKVAATARDKTLIIGLGQAHRFASSDEHRIERFFAYTILTDSSGLYRELRVLGSAPAEPEYISSFQANLSSLIRDAISEFDTFVLHTGFAIGHRELDVATDVVRQAAASNPTKSFVAIKINDQSKFFGYSYNSNSLIPLESSVVKLSNTEYLIWFEGLSERSPVAHRRFGGPLHLSFFYPRGKDIAPDVVRRHLQDAINLSGANWRGFNAKSIPVSLWYSKLVARFVKQFDAAGCGPYNVSDFSPWFL
jgi:hypothetical protein